MLDSTTCIEIATRGPNLVNLTLIIIAITYIVCKISDWIKEE